MPDKAAAAADSGETRYTPAVVVPERPKKLRLDVRTETPFVLGAIELPMQNPHAVSRIRAPEAMMSASAPFLAAISSTCRDPHATPSDMPEAIFLPFRTAATCIISRYDPFVHEPIIT